LTSPLIQGCTYESIIFVLDAATTFDVTSTVMVTKCRGYRRALATTPRDCHPPEISSLMYVHIRVGEEPCQDLPSGDRLLRCILACSAPLAVEQPAVRVPSPSFGRMRDRQAIQRSGASTESAAGLPALRPSSGTSSAAGCGGRSRERGSPDPGSQTFYLQISIS